MALLPEIKRAVQKNGITIDYVMYFSEVLRKWIIPTQYKKIKPDLDNCVVCRRDPRDISKIYVYDEDIKDYIVVPYADIKRPKINLSELRASIAEAKRVVTGRDIETHDVFEAYDRLKRYIENAIDQKKIIKRKQNSKLHQEKTLQLDKERINYQGKQIKLKVNIDDNQDGYDLYPVE